MTGHQNDRPLVQEITNGKLLLGEVDVLAPIRLVDLARRVSDFADHQQ